MKTAVSPLNTMKLISYETEWSVSTFTYKVRRNQFHEMFNHENRHEITFSFEILFFSVG